MFKGSIFIATLMWLYIIVTSAVLGEWLMVAGFFLFPVTLYYCNVGCVPYIYSGEEHDCITSD